MRRNHHLHRGELVGVGRGHVDGLRGGRHRPPSTGNGHLYRCIVAGVGRLGADLADRERQHRDRWHGDLGRIGRGVTVIDAADPSWSTATLTARMAVVYKSTGTASTSPLLCVIDFGADVSSTAATYQITLPAVGIFNFATP